jgi:hypothetical protein
MKEPSIYDYLRSLFDQKTTINIREFLTNNQPRIIERSKNIEEITSSPPNKWKIITGAGFAVVGQILLEPAFLHTGIALLLYLISFILIWEGLKSQQILPLPIIQGDGKRFCFTTKNLYLSISLVFLMISFILFSGNTFNWPNLSFWIMGTFLMIFSFWKPIVYDKIKSQHIELSFITVLLIANSIILFFRLYLLNEVPSEMFSDHAEKLLDVMDVLRGKYSIFFERNTGREPIQFYFTALIINIFNTKINFMSLKVGTVIFGLLTLPFIYLIAKELSNKWGGFFALLFAGIGYWPNVISRVGLRYSLYPLFTAPVFYFIIKGLKEKNTNYFLVSGIFLGFGLFGYSSFRIIPFLVVVIFILYYLFNKKSNDRVQTFTGIILIGLVSLSVFLPIFRYWFDHSGSFSYRALSRLTQIERPFNEPAIVILLKNILDSILMPFYRNGQIWVHSVPNRPALDLISASSFFVGLVFMIYHVRNQKNWEFAALLISIPVLMMPSILSLAYPGENPSLNRSAGSLVPIFVVIGIGINVFIRSIVDTFSKKNSKIIAILLGILIITISMINNYQLVFNTYGQQFDKNAWNSSEIGGVIKKFVQAGNNPERAFVIPFPHWVDTRLVGFNADYPGKDYALSRSAISETALMPDEKIYIYKPEDIETQAELEQWFPDGQVSIFYSEVPGKEFIIYTVKKK